MNPFEVKYEHLNEEGFRARLLQEVHRLELLAYKEKDAGFEDLHLITKGRVSGVYLALSFLDEFVVRENE